MQCVVIFVFPDCLPAFFLGGNIGIIGIHAYVKGILLLVGEGCGFGLECVENHFRRQFLVVIIRKGEPCRSKMQSVSFLIVRNLQQFGYVSVGNIVQSLDFFAKLITVLDYHQFVSPHQSLFLELYSRPDTQIVFYGPLVGTAQNDRLILSVTGICIRKCFDQVTAPYSLNILEITGHKSQFIRSVGAVIVPGYHLPQPGGIFKYA